jgi:ABC-type phosphate/phosphonate transport system permease subunit
VQIALWGTLLAIVCAIPLGILCSENSKRPAAPPLLSLRG